MACFNQFSLIRRSLYAASIFLLIFGCTQEKPVENIAVINATQIDQKISKFIYSHFSEHLGNCIYDGIWVGENSPIPNYQGIRTDVVDALRHIQIPALRWPGGCFADEYHWMDGIGPKSKRPKMINTHWGGVTEDNSFGTHEFMELCAQLSCEAYISGNIGSGTVQEMSQWVEYLNSDNESPMTDLRKANGREDSWGVQFWGVGNETWGCGGRMKPQYYADLARHYSTFLKNYGDNRLKQIAVGANGADYEWTEVLMREIGTRYFWGLALHYYTNLNGSATEFGEDEWFKVMQSTLKMEELIQKHSTIMDKYDPMKKVALVVDEWGTWYQVDPGTNPGFLYQQNSLRDALVAGINLNIFHNHCDRVKMTAIAQVVNVLQSMILTKGEMMLLTPTYHVFDMYKVHHDAYLVPSTLTTENYTLEDESVPALNLSSSIDQNGKMHISVCNLHATEMKKLTCNLKGYKALNGTGEIVTANKLNVYNSFDNPENITLNNFVDFTINNHQLIIDMPPHSVVTISLDGSLDTPDNSVHLKTPVQGLQYQLFEGAFFSVNDFIKMKPIETGTIGNIVFPERARANNFGLTYKGFIKVEHTGMYNFFLASDDGSTLVIDGKTIIDNDGRHGVIEREGLIYLHEGFHPVELKYFQSGGGSSLSLEIQELSSNQRQPLTENNFSHEKTN